uniref:Uncharacterized protein n=1 Tax=Lygus hesperus TaxID=30085 RepID=A0A146L5L8_LYGHE
MTQNNLQTVTQTPELPVHCGTNDAADSMSKVICQAPEMSSNNNNRNGNDNNTSWRKSTEHEQDGEGLCKKSLQHNFIAPVRNSQTSVLPFSLMTHPTPNTLAPLSPLPPPPCPLTSLPPLVPAHLSLSSFSSSSPSHPLHACYMSQRSAPL